MNGVAAKPLATADEGKPRGVKSGWRTSRAMNFVRQNLLLILTVVGILLGFLVGLIIRPYKPSPDVLMWLGFPGELFMRLLKMMILPLIICSVISGTASLNPKANGKISVLAFVYCLTTNFIACLIGLVYSLIIRPARYVTESGSATVKTQMLQTQDIFADLIRNLVPDNIVEACFRQDQTKYIKERVAEDLAAANGTDVNVTATELYTVTKTLGKADGANILGLVVACVLIGISVNKSGDKGKPFLAFFTSATEIVLNLLSWLLWYTPVGVASLIAVSLGSIDDIEKAFVQLGLFVVTVTVGVVTHQVVVMPLIIFFLAGINPIRFMLNISRAWMIGFATTATAVAIPEMLQASEGPNKVDKRVSRFVIPFCVTMNADGSAIYITAATLFVAAVTGNSLEASTVIITVVLVSIAALAIPSVPSASIVTIVVILTSLSIPANQIAFLFTVEWFLDRIRTSSNVVSHTTGAAVVYRFCKADLDKLPDDTDDIDVEMEVLIDNSVPSPNTNVIVK